jgi:hypothetical protein
MPLFRADCTITQSYLCSTQLPVHQRMNANSVLLPNDLFPETDNTIKHNSCYGCWCSNYYTIHNNTHSVYKRHLVLWRARLLCFEASRYVYPPPLSGANCPPFPPPGGPVPLASKMAPISPGSTHTPSTPSVTIPLLNFLIFINHLRQKCISRKV